MTADEALVWSAFLSSSTLLVYVLTGRRTARLRAVGWTVALLSEAGWAYYGWASGGRFFAVQAVVFVVVALWNLATLRRPGTECRCNPHAAGQRPDDDLQPDDLQPDDLRPGTDGAATRPGHSTGRLQGRVEA